MIDCPVCNAPFEGEGRGRHAGKSPQAGSHALCVYCMSRLVYVEDENGVLGVRPMTDEEFENAPEYAQANILQTEALAREIRSHTPRVSSLVDKINQLGHAVGEVDRGVSTALYRLSQLHGLLVQKHGPDELSMELERIMAILESIGR